MGRRLVWDTETDGLRRQVTKIHLLIIRDIDTNEEWVFRNRNNKEELFRLLEIQAREPDPKKRGFPDLAPFVGWIEDGLKMLEEADLSVGQNIVQYDIPVIEDLYPGWGHDAKIRDTLILSRLLFSNIKEEDYVRFRKGELPGKYIGSHGLAAWGYRLGEHKIDFGKDEGIDAWAKWTPEMEVYGRQDVVSGRALYLFLEQEIARLSYSDAAIRLEHRFADLLARIEHNGFPFNEAAAQVLYQELLARKDTIKVELLRQFRPQYKAKKWATLPNGKPATWKDAVTTVPAKTLNYKDPLTASRTKGAAYCEVVREEFNPGSRDQIADRLQRMFGWKPQEFTPTGKPRVSEDILRDLVGTEAEDDEIEETEEELYERFVKSVPQAKNLADYFLVQKRIGQLAEGKNGWLKLVEHGKVHGTVNGLGAVTRRVTHAKPNMSQCPAIRSPYGVEMRALWHVPEGWLQFGTDLSGIEIRCFADVLAEHDNGAYADIVVNGDVHTVNQKAFGVPTRDNSKTTLYALLYGAGDFKLGSIIGQGADAGRRIKKNFMTAIPAYGQVVRQLTKLVDRRGWIPALDGGRLHVRSPHKALNTSLQSAGALVAKHWTCLIEEKLLDLGWQHGWNGQFAFLGFFHDELQIAVKVPESIGKAYVNDTPYHTWTPKEDETDDDLKKRIKKHKEKHLQDWYHQFEQIRTMGRIVKEAIKEVEQHFEFLCPLDCEYKIGRNWADCH